MINFSSGTLEGSSGSLNNQITQQSGTISAVKGTVVSTSGEVIEGNSFNPGSVFEAVVKEIKNNQIFLSLENGQILSAKLMGDMPFEKGQSVNFLVKSNDGEQIAIKPMPMSDYSNPALLKALDAANMSADASNLSMVKAMMDEQLPINRQSLMDMHRQLLNNPGTDIKTIVAMIKNNIPITQNNLTQFNNYKNYEYQLLGQIEDISDKLSNISFKNGILQGGENLEDAQTILNSNTSADIEQAVLKQNINAQSSQLSLEDINIMRQTIEQNSVEFAGTILEDGSVNDDVAADKSFIIKNFLNNISNTDNSFKNELFQAMKNSNTEGMDNIIKLVASLDTDSIDKIIGVINNRFDSKSINTNNTIIDIATESGAKFDSINNILNQPQKDELINALKNIGASDELIGNIEKGEITQDKVLTQIKQLLTSKENVFEQLNLEDLFSKSSYKKLLKNTLEHQWLLKPEQVADEENVEQLYSRLNRHMGQISDAIAASLKGADNLNQAASAAKSNIEFMNDINQMFTYVQLPLKMSGQNAHSDLYVYTNKKRLADKEGEVTALLHLDMEKLGPLDVFLKLKDTKLDTQFSIQDKISRRLFENNIDRLKARLEQKGYLCSVEFTDKPQEKNLINDIISAEGTSGAVQRYSFDVRA